MNGPNRRVEFAKVFFLGFFCAVALIALMGQHLSPASPQRIGQYQMRMFGNENHPTIYVLDTTTGAVKRVAADDNTPNVYYKQGTPFAEPISVDKNR